MDSLHAGDMITVSGLLAKDETSLLGQATITTADGKRVFSGAGPRRNVEQQP